MSKVCNDKPLWLYDKSAERVFEVFNSMEVSVVHGSSFITESKFSGLFLLSAKLTLLVLVAQATCLVWSGGPRGAMDLGELAILPAADAEQVPEDIRLLLAVQLRHVLVPAHGDLDEKTQNEL